MKAVTSDVTGFFFVSTKIKQSYFNNSYIQYKANQTYVVITSFLVVTLRYNRDTKCVQFCGLVNIKLKTLLPVVYFLDFFFNFFCSRSAV